MVLSTSWLNQKNYSQTFSNVRGLIDLKRVTLRTRDFEGWR